MRRLINQARIVRFSPGVSYNIVRGTAGIVRSPDWAFQLPNLPVSFEACLSQIPRETSKLRDEAINSGEAAVDALRALSRLEALEEAVIDSNGEVIALARRPYVMQLPNTDDEQTVFLGRQTFFRFDGDEYLILSVNSKVVVSVKSDWINNVFDELSKPTSIKDLSVIGSFLFDNGLLAFSNKTEESCWSFHDALFHAVSAHGYGTEGGYGATWAGRKKNQVNKVSTEERAHTKNIELPDDTAHCDADFANVLVRRRSRRDYAKKPLSINELSALLDMALRAQYVKTSKNGLQVAFHSYPSGGACNEITTFIANRGGSEDESTAYVAEYCELEHRLKCYENSSANALAIIKQLSAVCGIDSQPGAALIFAADYECVEVKYEAVAYATILRNVGAIYQTVSLVAEALEMGSCAVGGGWGDIEKYILKDCLQGRVIIGGMLVGWPALDQ